MNCFCECETGMCDICVTRHLCNGCFNCIPTEIKYLILSYLPLDKIIDLNLSNKDYWLVYRELYSDTEWNPYYDWKSFFMFEYLLKTAIKNHKLSLQDVRLDLENSLIMISDEFEFELSLAKPDESYIIENNLHEEIYATEHCFYDKLVDLQAQFEDELYDLFCLLRVANYDDEEIIMLDLEELLDIKIIKTYKEKMYKENEIMKQTTYDFIDDIHRLSTITINKYF